MCIRDRYVIDAALVVTTPSVLAAADAAKCLSMLKKMGIHISGIVENMAYFEDENGNKSYIFGNGGGAKLAKEFDTQVLVQIPVTNEVTIATEKSAIFTLFDENTSYSSFIDEISNSFTNTK